VYDAFVFSLKNIVPIKLESNFYLSADSGFRWTQLLSMFQKLINIIIIGALITSMRNFFRKEKSKNRTNVITEISRACGANYQQSLLTFMRDHGYSTSLLSEILNQVQHKFRDDACSDGQLEDLL